MTSRSIFSGLFILSLVGFNFEILDFRTYEDAVYICNGPNSKVYHKSSSCKGLNRCSTQILKVTQSVANGKGRRACKIEF